MSLRSSSIMLALATLLAATAEAKPRKYAWEIYPFIGMRDYDANLNGLTTHGIFGARVGYNLTRRWEIEAGMSVDNNNEDDAGRANVDVEDLSLNLLYNFNTGDDEHQKHGRWMSGDRWIPYLTVGFGHFSATDDPTGTRESNTLNFGVGTRIMAADFVGVRFDARDTLSLEDDDFGDNFSNIEVSVGATFIVGGAVPRDSDSDGVVDSSDKCPGTPLGCWVDEVGCPKDSDGDGVCDGLDRCPGTPAGCQVDQHGCPLDEDGDGVCDALDDCPGTPAGCWVNDRGCPKDADGDTVCDGVDQCPDTPAGCKVDAKGCPLDEDGDGVCDGVDQCPGTPKGTKVDAKGCPVEVVRLVLANVHFAFARAEVRPFYAAVLDQVAASLLAAEWRSVELELRGHTDAIDTTEYNYRLGQQRADAVKDYLVGKGVAPARITTKSFSELEPVAPNANADGSDNPEGRALNRRVEMVPTTAVAQPPTVVKVLVRDNMFVGGSAELSAAGRATLDEIASAFGAGSLASVRFRIEGPAAQAQAAASHLAGKGVARDRIDVASGAGKVQVLPVGK